MTDPDAAKTRSSATRLVVDLSSAGLARLALVESGASVPGKVATYRDADFSTMTEVFRSFERDRSMSLSNARVAIAIAGVATGTTVPIARSRWTLSRDGLDRYFGQPVTIVNEVAAKAWSIFGTQRHETRELGGTRPLAPTHKGRWAFISFADGLGVSVIDTTGNGRRVIDTEAGHAGMTVADEEGDTIVAELRRRGQFPSWENAMRLVVASNAPRLPDHAVQHCLGALAADMVYTFAAWDGVIFGDRAAELLRSQLDIAAFLTPARLKRPYDRMLAQVPSWALQAQQLALRGCAIMLD